MSKNVLAPKLLRRGFEIFAGISLIGFLAVLLYTGDLEAFVRSLGGIRWGWILVGVGLASMDWIGGGLRLWVVARQVHPDPPLGGMILAGGMSAWAAYLTPLQSGAAPMMVYTMKRYGVPVPVAMTSTLMTFIATVAFFAIAGPLAIVAGAGKSLGEKGNLLGLSLYDLFLGSLSIFAGLGVILVLVIFFPRVARNVLYWLTDLIGRRSERLSRRLDRLRAGIDQAHESAARFNTPRGWLSLLWATMLSAPSHANKLLAGYVALRVVGIEAQFVDILLVQTLVMFLLYFAPTPGASGVAEVTSALVMSVYVPSQLVPLYTVVWRAILSYFTLAFGALVFYMWLRGGARELEEDTAESAAAVVVESGG